MKHTTKIHTFPSPFLPVLFWDILTYTILRHGSHLLGGTVVHQHLIFVSVLDLGHSNKCVLVSLGFDLF